MSGPKPRSEVTDKGDLREDAAGDGCGDGGNERACNARSVERSRKPNCGILYSFFREAGWPANRTLKFPRPSDPFALRPSALPGLGSDRLTTCRAASFWPVHTLPIS